MTVKIKGQDRTLDLEKFWVVKYYEDFKKNNPGTDTFGTAVAIVYGGLMAVCKEEKKDPDFTTQDVEEAVGSMKTSEVTALMAEFNKDPGEAQAQA